MLSTSKITFKPIERDDLEIILNWRNSMNNFPYSGQYFLLNMAMQKNYYLKLRHDQSLRMFMMLYDKTKIGVCGLTYIDRENKCAHNNLLIGDTRFRDRGFGKIMYEFVTWYGFHIGMNKIIGIVFEYNDIAKHRLQKLGYMVEVTHRDAIWRDNKYWNTFVFSLLKDEMKKEDLTVTFKKIQGTKSYHVVDYTPDQK